MNRVLNQPRYSPLSTLSIRRGSAINCNTRHAVRIEYLRELVKLKGGFPRVQK